MAIDGTRPERVWCTGTEHCTIVEAYPYHRVVNVVDHKGAGEDEIAYDPQCSRFREEAGEEPYTMLCETCERFPAVAYVRIDKVEGEQKTA